MKKKLKIFISGALIVTIIGTAYVWKHTTRGMLPFSAGNVRVYYKSFGTQGWSYYLKAQLPERDCIEYSKRLRLRPMPEAYQKWPYSREWETRKPIEWWDPTAESQNTYGRNNGVGYDYLKCENGHVYYRSIGS